MPASLVSVKTFMNSNWLAGDRAASGSSKKCIPLTLKRDLK